MIVLQAAWASTGKLYVWGEKTGGAPSPEFDAQAVSHAHPFAAASDELREALDLLGGFEPDEEETITVLLPTSGNAPLSSPKLRAGDADLTGEEEVVLLQWEIPALSFASVPALSMLTSLPGQLPAGVRLDHSFQFWREPSKLLLELLTRGRFLPGLQRKNGNWGSHWYVLARDDADMKKISVLADCMPPICRSLLAEEAPEPISLIESFISTGGDALIRSFLSRFSLLAGVQTGGLSETYKVPLLWLNSLTAPNPELEAVQYEIAKFDQSVRRWAGRLIWTEERPQLKTCFKLRSPKDDSTAWNVVFSLRSVVNPKQEIFAEQLWRGELGFLQGTNATAEELEEILLKDLGQALPSFPSLKRALEQLNPTHVELQVEEAYQFLKEQAKRLEQQGFIVALPHWWVSPPAKLGLHLKVRGEALPEKAAPALSFLGMQKLLDYSWEIALGEERLDFEKFKTLVNLKQPLVQINGQWLELPQKKIAATLAFLENKEKKQQLSFMEALRLGFGVEQSDDILPVTGFSASGWIEKLLKRDKHELPALAEPEQFHGLLRPYQRDGLSWLALLSSLGIGGCLADDMGLGKTIQLLALLSYERQTALETEGTVQPTLLIVPMSIISNWKREAERFTPSLRLYVHHGADRLNKDEFRKRAQETDVVITTYSLAHRDISLLTSVNWGRICLDEAQNIKNLGTKQTKAIRYLARRTATERTGFAHRVVLTGTPLENHLEELWSIFDFLNPGFLGPVEEFRRHFAIPIERYRDKEASGVLSHLISPFVLRRLKTDPTVLPDLPDKIEMDELTGLTAEQAALYETVVQQMLPQVDAASGIHRKGLVLATITKLKQICNHPLLFLKSEGEVRGRSAKLERIEEIIEEVLAEGDKVLLFTQYAQFGHLLRPYLQERFDTEVLFLHGGLNRAAREKVIDKFQKKDGPSLFILSLKAGGFGLNLTEANQVVHIDQWWNPAVQEQATDRAYRIGQHRSVQVRRFICRGTLEEKIHQMLQYKRDLADQVVGSTKNMVLQLSTEELRNMLQLSSGRELP